MVKEIKDFSGCLILLVIFVGFMVFLYYANSKNNKDNSDKTIGKYVYLDINETLHVHRHCAAIGNQPGNLGRAERTVTRIPVEHIDMSMLDLSCSRYVSDEVYEKLKEIIMQKDTSLTPPSRRR